MLRQLARLTRPLPAAGPEALAVAVYADERDGHVVAKESGHEGVACVDDAARLLDVLCDVWARTRLPWAERWARGLLGFVLWMQEPDGRWINFVRNWEGTRNSSGITSETGENFWHARALVGVSHAWLTFADERAHAALLRGLDHAVMKPAPPDVRALHVLTARRLIADAGMHQLARPMRGWVHDLAACREGDVLKNAPAETGTPHLWAHIQEGVLAWSAAVVGERELVDVAARSAEALIVPAVEASFAGPSSSPYDVAACVYGLDRLHEATGDPRWERLASDARAWFDGRNAAGAPVYDRARGRVADGVDGDRVSENSGAEANIVGAEALFADALEEAAGLADPITGFPGD
jgi:hypothetical protein